MKDSIVYLLYSLLKTNKITIDEEEVKFQLLSHPSYPSLHALTGVLDHFSIENLAAQVPTNIETLSQLDADFITQIKNDTGEHFVLFKRKNDQINLIFSRDHTQVLSEQEFLDIWSGIILVIEPKEDNSESVLNRKNKILRKVAVIFSILFFIGLFIILRPTLSELIFYILSYAGLAFSIFIVIKELGVQSTTVDKLCAAGQKNVNCDAVLNSKGATIFQNIKLSDLSLVYFIGMLFSCFLLSLLDQSYDLLYTLTFASIPITLYSIFYQFRVVKSWCVLCLCIVGVLWLQSVSIYALGFSYKEISFDLIALVTILFSFTIMSAGWSYIFPLLKKEIEFKNLKIDHYKFKRNYFIFETLLSKSDILPKGSIDPNEIVLGDKAQNPKLSITIITNPACGHCKETHTLVEEILQRNLEKVQIIIRFNVPAAMQDNPSTKITARLIELYHKEGEEKCITAMHDAYINLKRDEWLQKWDLCHNQDFFDILKIQNEWCKLHHKNFTPEILIEGKSFPKEYNRKELLYFVEDLLEE